VPTPLDQVRLLVTSFENPIPKHSAPAASAKVNESASAHAPKVNWTREGDRVNSHNAPKQHRTAATEKRAGKTGQEHSQRSEPGESTADHLAGGSDKLSQEASKRFAEAAIRNAQEKPAFGGLKSQASVAELHFSDPFEYLGDSDPKHTRGFPNKSEA